MSKNLVLCSDGTGNSAAKRGEGTNVWKIYRAIDVSCTEPRQLNFYDDGVGTESFKFLKALGGAFGYGLTRNIRDLYGALVHQYEPGDQIFLFGFSRGAFTVRSLAGLIFHCGLVDRHRFQGPELNDLVGSAVDTYRKAHRRNDPSIAEAFRSRYGVANPEGGPGCVDPRDIPIKMIGVWDTVDAVGLPVDELTVAFDKLFHFRFHRFGLNRCVEHGYHALAVDDERHTFHPVLWEETAQDVDKEHQVIEQVWFPGVHTNVGGGYPRDQLAMVSLDWMMGKAEACGLHFRKELWQGFREEANPQGKLYDSRSGFSVYYRYRPRDVAELSGGMLAGPAVKIHASVFERAYQGTEDYAPFNLPAKYDVVGACDVTPEEKRPEQRHETMEQVWDLVFWRRVSYFGFVGTSLLLLLMGIWLPTSAQETHRVDWGVFDPVFQLAVWAAPAIAEGWIVAFRDNPFWLFAFLTLFALLLFFSTRMKRRISEVSVAAWRHSFGLHSSEVRPPGWLQKLGRRLRTSWLALRLAPWLKVNVLPWVVLALAVAGTAWGVKELVAGPEPQETACGVAQVALPLEMKQSRMVKFDARCPRQATEIVLEAGAKYQFEVAVKDPWRSEDDSLWWTTPWRRSWKEGWFELLGDVGAEDEDPFVIGSAATVPAERTGRLYLYVNDAVCFLCPTLPWRKDGKSGPWYFYGNNEGTAEVTVTRLAISSPDLPGKP